MLSILSLIAAVSAAYNAFTNPVTDITVNIGSQLNVSWANASGSTVNLILCTGDPNNLQTVSTIARDIPNQGHYLWTIPSDLKDGKYALEIKSDSADNYSPMFYIHQNGASSSAKSSSAKSSSSAVSSSVKNSSVVTSSVKTSSSVVTSSVKNSSSVVTSSVKPSAPPAHNATNNTAPSHNGTSTNHTTPPAHNDTSNNGTSHGHKSSASHSNAGAVAQGSAALTLAAVGAAAVLLI